MLLDLIQKYDIDETQSFMVGDRDMDIEAGRVFIGEKEPAGFKPDYTFPNLYEAVAGLIEQEILQMKSTS